MYVVQWPDFYPVTYARKLYFSKKLQFSSLLNISTPPKMFGNQCILKSEHTLVDRVPASLREVEMKKRETLLWEQRSAGQAVGGRIRVQDKNALGLQKGFSVCNKNPIQLTN